MKSVMQEASSIAKAIEQAWLSAGKPAEFSIKVLEEPQKNFLGFTIRSAKVALYFDVAPAPKPHATHKQRVTVHKPADYAKQVESNPKQEEQRAKVPAPKATPKAPVERKERKSLWDESTITFVKDWMNQTLTIMHLDTIRFTIEPSDFYLRITFDKPLLETQQQEKKLLASFAALIIESLKHAFKTGFKGHKIILSHITHDTQSTEPR